MVDRNIGEYNRVTASTDSYVRTNFNIKPTDEETRNVISSTFGVMTQINHLKRMVKDIMFIQEELENSKRIMKQETLLMAVSQCRLSDKRSKGRCLHQSTEYN